MLSLANIQVVNSMKSCICKNLGKRVTALVVMIIITVSSVGTVMAATMPVELVYNGKNYTLQTTSGETKEILKQAQAQYPEIKIGENDKIARDEGGEKSTIRINVQSAYDLSVVADDVSHSVRAYYGEAVSDVLRAAGVVLGANDESNPAQTGKITAQEDVTVTRRYAVSVTADGNTRELLAPAGTVQKTLKNMNVTLGADDTVSVNLDERVCDGMKIKVARVSYKEVTEEKTIEFKTIVKQDSSMARGQSKVETQGEEGSQTVVTRQKLVDGQLAEKTVLKATVTKESVDQVKVVGTKKKNAMATVGGNGTLIDQNGNVVHYSKVITGKCSAYTGGGHTATGKKAAFGRVAVNPNIIPYGTRLYICSPNGKIVYGYATAADTGGGVMDGRILADLYYDTYGQCRQIGKRNMNIYVLN